MASAAATLSQTASSLPFDRERSEADGGLSAFAGVRSRLFGIAYRMLRSAAEAEDIVQDVWLRWQSTDRSAVQDPPAFLATTTTRLCINLAQSVRSRRETGTGTRPPEPVDDTGPELVVERSEALRLAVQLLLEKLSPAERAAYVLREAFDYSYRQIAGILLLQEANARQLVSRARKHLCYDRRTPATRAEQRRLLEAFMDAAQTGDMAALERLFAEEVVYSLSNSAIMRTIAGALTEPAPARQVSDGLRAPLLLHLVA
ncbi:MAG TPA: sigma-70 family RNA polymerase sigma factor [Terriglobales bacterium]